MNKRLMTGNLFNKYRKLEVPMIWPINHDGCSVEVSNSFASLSLDDQLEEYAYK